MPVIPKSLFLFCQIFGMFPLVYTEKPNHDLSIQFSPGLFLKCLCVMIFLGTTSFFVLYEDYTGYLNGHPIRINSSALILTVIMDVIILNLFSVLVLWDVSRKYRAFIRMSESLQKIDQTLGLQITHPWLTFKILTTFIHITAVLTVTLVKRSMDPGTPRIFYYLPFWSNYYIVAALFLQFTFVVDTLSERFRAINEKIKEEIMKQTFEQMLMVDIGLSKSTGNSDGRSSLYRLRALTDAYSKLCEVVEHANKFYRGQVLATICSSFIHNIITLYFFIQEVRQAVRPFNVVSILVQAAWVTSRVAHIVLLLWPCAYLSQAASETGPIVCQLLARDLFNPDLSEELKTFLLKLRHYKVELSALGFFPVHRHILTSIASSVTTYLVVMVDFQGTGTTRDSHIGNFTST